ncbi:hypothetical protein K1719_008158 [Acacia pycnantha]|nr:hypothetical protein K1719_008158 [Acacia pycnantha]
MGFPPFVLEHIPFVLLAALNIIALAQEGEIGDIGEIGGLYALLRIFKDRTLASNWTGEPCDNGDQARWIGIQCSNGHVSGIALEGRGLVGELIFGDPAFALLPHLSFISFKNNALSGNMMDLTNNPQMHYIDLSGNELNGSISSSFLGLNLLCTLLLQENRLTGNIPAFQQPSLKTFNVSNNDLEGSVPKTQTLQSFGPDSYSGNPRLCGPPSNNPCTVNSSPAPENDRSHNHSLLLIIGVVIFLAVALLLMIFHKRAAKLIKIAKGKIPTVRDEEIVGDNVQTEGERNMGVEVRSELIFFKDRPKFQMVELLGASAEGLSNQGIMGKSYKAMLHGGATVVVKKLRDLKPLSKEEFAKLLHKIYDMEHPNLLPLLAYYYSQDGKMLLYQYAQNGDLFFRLHGSRDRNRIPFKWRSRLSVATGIAQALDYLHQNTNTDIVPHGNLKSSNVLLDKDDEPLVSDYGLASLITPPIATQRLVVFKSPEYEHAKTVTKQSDVWSYGLLLIELLTNRVSACSAPPGFQGLDLSKWVRREVREEWAADIFDAEIAGERKALPGILRVLEIAIRCIDRLPENRPEMWEVLRELEKVEATMPAKDEEHEESGDRYSTSYGSFSTSSSGIIRDDKWSK